MYPPEIKAWYDCLNDAEFLACANERGVFPQLLPLARSNRWLSNDVCDTDLPEALPSPIRVTISPLEVPDDLRLLSDCLTSLRTSPNGGPPS